MNEQIITYKTAKLAKEKGFNIYSHSYYFEDGEFKEFEINDTYGYYGDEYTVTRSEFYEDWNDKLKTAKNGNRCFGCDNNPKYLTTFSAPTQSLLQKWLRERHQIIVSSDLIVGFGYFEFTWHIYMYNNIWNLSHFTAKTFKTYEKALEQGLYTALTLLK